MAFHDPVSLLVFAFVAGAFTFLAPCAYPLLPGYVSFYLGERSSQPAGGGIGVRQGRVTGGVTNGLAAVLPAPLASRLARALVVGLLVSVGFFVVYGVLVGVVVAFGARALSGISVLELVVGGLLVVVGSAMALGWHPPMPAVRLPERRRSAGSYVGFGVVYAAAAAGCTAPLFVGLALTALSAGAGRSLLVFGAYAAGMSALMVGVTVAAALGRGALGTWLADRLPLIQRAAGVFLAAAGLVQIYFYLFRFGGLRALGL